MTGALEIAIPCRSLKAGWGPAHSQNPGFLALGPAGYTLSPGHLIGTDESYLLPVPPS